MLSQRVEKELLLAVGIVIAIAEPLEALLHRYAFFDKQDKGLFEQMVSKNWQFLFANIAIGVFAQYLYVFRLTTPSLISRRMIVSSILLNGLGILLGCCPFAIMFRVVVVSSFRNCALLAIVVCSSVRKTSWNL